jgi:diaminohydroxyphosphoribosylaminopyrimidine deaminase / 5-amino-6-(5-phosphoribosylamino)uracil reductase
MGAMGETERGYPADATFMRRALSLARRGEGRTSPNPMVGAVLVADGAVVGEGWHHAAGTPHAEIHALRAAGPRAMGSTLYVTLEPCSHHGRTPPCADAVVAAGIDRVVVAMLDPDARIGGRGVERLRAAGVTVDAGMLEEEARRLNEAYVLHRTLGRPFVTCKSAVTFDGRTAAADGTSQWITGAEARRDVHRLRARSDAIVVGIGTVVADDPSLTVRGVPTRAASPPLRVVVDSGARTPLRAQVLSNEAPTLVVVSEDADPDTVERLRWAGADVLTVHSDSRGIGIPAMLEALGSRGIVSLLLEGGPRLAGGFVAAGAVDRFVFYVAPKLLGGPETSGAIEGWVAPSIGAAASLEIESVRRLGDDLRITARPRRDTTMDANGG